MDEDLFDQDVEVLEPHHVQGPSLSARRVYQKRETVKAHVKTLPAAEVTRHKMVGSDISHNLWFQAAPNYTEAHRLRWRGTVLRPNGPAVDLHGLGEVWMGSAKAITPDNETVEVME